MTEKSRSQTVLNRRILTDQHGQQMRLALPRMREAKGILVGLAACKTRSGYLLNDDSHLVAIIECLPVR